MDVVGQSESSGKRFSRSPVDALSEPKANLVVGEAEKARFAI